MRSFYIFIIFVVIAFISCNQKEKVYTQDNKLAKLNIEENIIYTENIFENLFSDIPSDYNEYENKIGYEIVEKYNDHYLLPKKEIIIKHECFYVTYYPSYYEYEKYGNDDQEIFIRESVEINKRTNEIILGEYIGENIKILLQKYCNVIENIVEYESHAYYSYGYHKNSTSDFRRINIDINVVNNIIEKISYGYEI